MNNFRFDPGDGFNPWIVKALRQCMHAYVWISLLALILIQFFFLLVWFLERPIERTGLILMGVALVIFCVFSALSYSVMYFSSSGMTGQGKSPLRPIEDFLNYVPIRPWELLRGALGYYTLLCCCTLVCALPTLLALMAVPDVGGRVLSWIPCFYLAGMMFVLAALSGRFRADIVVGGLATAAFIFCRIEDMEAVLVSEWFYALQLLLIAVYCCLVAGKSLLPRAREREALVRLGQLGLLVFSLFFCWRYPREGLLWGAPVCVAMAGAINSMAGWRFQRPRPEAGKRFKIGAFFFVGYSPGGWLWCWVVIAAGFRIFLDFQPFPFFRELPVIALCCAELIMGLEGRYTDSLNRLPGLDRFDTESVKMIAVFLIALLVAMCHAFAIEIFGIPDAYGMVAWWGVAAALLALQIPAMLKGRG